MDKEDFDLMSKDLINENLVKIHVKIIDFEKSNNNIKRFKILNKNIIKLK